MQDRIKICNSVPNVYMAINRKLTLDRKKMPAAESSDHLSVKAKIEGWLDAEGISFEQVKDLNSFFHIKPISRMSGIHISESKVRMGVLAVQGILDL